MIKPPCGHHCPNCGTVHTRCEKYDQFRQAKDEENALIRKAKYADYEINQVKADGIAYVTGRKAMKQL